MPIWFFIFCQYIPSTGTKLTALSFLIFKLCISLLIQFTPTASHSSLTSTDIFRPTLKYISLEFYLNFPWLHPIYFWSFICISPSTYTNLVSLLIDIFPSLWLLLRLCIYMYSTTHLSYKLIVDVTIFVDYFKNNYNIVFGIQKLPKIILSQNTQESLYFLDTLVFYKLNVWHPIPCIKINAQYHSIERRGLWKMLPGWNFLEQNLRRRKLEREVQSWGCRSVVESLSNLWEFLAWPTQWEKKRERGK